MSGRPPRGGPLGGTDPPRGGRQIALEADDGSRVLPDPRSYPMSTEGRPPMTGQRTHASAGDRAGRGLEALTRWVLAHKRSVGVFWIVLTIAGMFGASRVADSLDDQFSMPSSEAFATNQEIEDRFSSGGVVQPLVAVSQLPEGVSVKDAAVRSDLRRLEGRLSDAFPGSRVASYGSTADDAYVSDDERTTYAIVHPRIDDSTSPGPPEIDAGMIAAAQRAAGDSSVGGADVMLTGRAALEQAPEEENGPPSFLNETLIAGVGALAVLAFVFASPLAVVPLLMAVVAIPVTLLAVLGLTAITDVSFIVVFLVSLIGLGIAIDYALIVVMRWREERERGLSNEDAIRAAVATSGRAVLFSGTTVAIGLLAAIGAACAAPNARSATGQAGRAWWSDTARSR